MAMETTDTRSDNGHYAEPREPEVRDTTPEEDVRTVFIHRIAWGAVFAGVAISMVTQLLLNLLGLGFGAGLVDPQTADASSAGNFSIGAGLWWAISGIIAAGAGGYAAGRLSGRPEPTTTAWHGLTAWAFTTLAIFYLLTTAVGATMGGALSAISSAAGPVAQSATRPQGAMGAIAPGLVKGADPFSSLEQQIRASSGDPNAQREAAVSALRDLMLAQPAQQPEARERAVQALARAQNQPPEAVRGQVANYEQQYRQTVDQAKQTATRAADATTRTIFWSMLMAVIALVLGAVAAWWAGREAAVSPTITAAARRLRPMTRMPTT
jgi:hypothetical protein